MVVTNIFHTAVTRSMTYVAMTPGNQCRSDDDVINNSLLREGSVAPPTSQDRVEMKAEGEGGGE